MSHPFIDIISQLNMLIKNSRVSGRLCIKQSSLKVLLFLQRHRYISFWYIPNNMQKIDLLQKNNIYISIEVFFYIINNQNLLLSITSDRIRCSRKLSSLSKYSPNLTCVEVLQTPEMELLTAEECRILGCGGNNPFFIYI